MRLEALEHEPLVRRCIADVQDMNDMIDAVLEVFRAEGLAEPVRRTDVSALLRALRDDLVEQGHPVTMRGPAAMAPVQPAALRRALSNLAGNAVRHGGRADITVCVTDGVVDVFIDDQGPGIPAGQLEAVFEPFYRVDRGRDRHGAGLGLYIARELVQRQGGRLVLANRPEGGLRASVSLPAPSVTSGRNAPGGP
jgi:protein-histidine pros-kinase